MYLKLKNVERRFKVEAPTERSVKGADKYFWLISLTVNEQLTTEQIEEYFIPENTSEMTFITLLPNDTEYEYKISGYVDKVFNLIKHLPDGGCAVELQFTKSPTPKSVL